MCSLTLLAAADAGSVYDPHPTLTYEWDPEDAGTRSRKPSRASTVRRPARGMSFDLGPHPTDILSTVSVTNLNGNANGNGTSGRKTITLTVLRVVVQQDFWQAFEVCRYSSRSISYRIMTFPARSLPVALASCAVLGAAVGTYDYGGKQLYGSTDETAEQRRKRFFKHPPPDRLTPPGATQDQ